MSPEFLPVLVFLIFVVAAALSAVAYFGGRSFQGWLMIVAGTAATPFAIYNWHDQTMPSPPQIGVDAPEENRRASLASYEEAKARVGRDSVIHKSVAIPLTFVGIILVVTGLIRTELLPG